MKIAHLATFEWGGAGTAAIRLNRGLRNAGIESQVYVREKVTASSSRVERIQPSKRSLFGRLKRRIDASKFARQRLAYACPAGSYVTDDRVPGVYDLNRILPCVDVYHLHWVSGLIDHRHFFANHPFGKPLVWTLHDMNPFTGGCHYALDCLGFRQTCGMCPQLGSDDRHDLSAKIHARKSAGYSNLALETTRIVSPSKWLGMEASRSSLLGQFSVDVIPNGVDTDVFFPRGEKKSRAMFEVPPDDLVIVFVSDHIQLRLKGFDLLRDALRQCEVGRPVTLLVVGKTAEITAWSNREMWLGTIDSECQMSFALSAADLFVLPTRADNLPNVILEAMACGVPVVSFAVGGVPDVVRPGVTGLLAPPEDVRALRHAIEVVLRDDQLRTKMSEQCRKIAVEEYSVGVQAQRYKTLYESLCESSARLAAKDPFHDSQHSDFRGH